MHRHRRKYSTQYRIHLDYAQSPYHFRDGRQYNNNNNNNNNFMALKSEAQQNKISSHVQEPGTYRGHHQF